jgi:hypothetical protein
MSTPTLTSPEAPTPTAPKPKRRCRSLRTNGTQCNSWTLGDNGDFCYTHSHYRHPECPRKGSKIVMPLLEDHSAIQLVLSQLSHGIFSGALDNASARTLAYVCQVAAFTLPRPATPNAKSAAPANLQEPVADVVTTPDGEHLAPIEKYQGPTGTFEPQWSFSKYLYEKQCEELGQPKPTCAADYPASGWLTEEEMKEDPEEWIKRTHAHKLELYKADDARKAQETAAALAAGLPDPHLKRKNPVCPFDTYWCDGPKHSHKCAYCAGEMKMDPSDPLYPGDQVIASLKACADPAPVTRPKPNPPRPTPRQAIQRATISKPPLQQKRIKSALRPKALLETQKGEQRGDIKLDNTANLPVLRSLRRSICPGEGPLAYPSKTENPGKKSPGNWMEERVWSGPARLDLSQFWVEVFIAGGLLIRAGEGA